MNTEQSLAEKGLVGKMLFLLLRLVRVLVGILGLWQVVGILPALKWLSNVSAVDGGMIAFLFLKILIMALAGAVFYGLRRFINWLHHRWYGVPHPSL